RRALRAFASRRDQVPRRAGASPAHRAHQGGPQRTLPAGGDRPRRCAQLAFFLSAVLGPKAWCHGAVRSETRMANPRPSYPTITRTFKASARQVFAARTRPCALKRWMGPGAFAVLTPEADVRVGGRFRIVMQGSGGAPIRKSLRTASFPSAGLGKAR